MVADQSTSNELKGKRLLLVEDDADLSEQLREVFRDHGADIKQVSCLEAARAELPDNAAKLDLVVLDIMLPVTKEHLKRVRELDRQLAEVRKTLRKERTLRDDDEKSRVQIEDAYQRRVGILAERETLVEREAGLKLLDDIAKSAGTRGEPPAVLVLTAVGTKREIEKGLSIVGKRGDWLVKPVTPESIIEKAADLASR